MSTQEWTHAFTQVRTQMDAYLARYTEQREHVIKPALTLPTQSANVGYVSFLNEGLQQPATFYDWVR